MLPHVAVEDFDRVQKSHLWRLVVAPTTVPLVSIGFVCWRCCWVRLVVGVVGAVRVWLLLRLLPLQKDYTRLDVLRQRQPLLMHVTLTLLRRDLERRTGDEDLVVCWGDLDGGVCAVGHSANRPHSVVMWSF